MGSTIFHILKESEERLHGVDSPRLSAELLMTEVLGCRRIDLTLDRDRILTESEVAAIRNLVERREQGEPVAYILGRREFYGLDFSVTPDTLIPRPETEHIIEEVEQRFESSKAFRFADLGTGSGILAVTLATLFPNASGVAVDMSEGALDVARKNATSHGVGSRIEFLNGDFTKPLFPDHTFDLVVSNPPYVTRGDYENASQEVTAYEPKTALISGDDGLNHIRSMLPRVSAMVRTGGLFLMEIGYQQGQAIIDIVSSRFPEFNGIVVKKDLSGHDRIVVLRKGNSQKNNSFNSEVL